MGYGKLAAQMLKILAPCQWGFLPDTHAYKLTIEPTCAYCTVGSYASLSVRLSVCPSVTLDEIFNVCHSSNPLPIRNVPAKFEHDRSINGRGDVEQTDGRTKPNYSMMYMFLDAPLKH